MGYGVDFPLSRLGKVIILWVIRVYGLPEVWVKRVSTVASSRATRDMQIVIQRRWYQTIQTTVRGSEVLWQML